MGTIPRTECTVDLVGTFAPADPVFPSVYPGLGLKLKPTATKTLVSVHVHMPKAELVLAQGQYAAIVNFIQQNFAEPDPGILPVIWPLPTNYEVMVGDNIYAFPDMYRFIGCGPRLEFIQPEIFQRGTDPTNKFSAQFSTVPVEITVGRILLIDNDAEYYKYMNEALLDGINN